MTNRRSRRRALTTVLAAASGIALAAPATGLAAGNPWTTPENQFLNMAHQGGELEAPGNTLYAFKTALKDRGADAVEMDSYITSDGYLVISHNATLGGTTNFGTPDAPAPFNIPGASPYIWDYTLAELQTLDDAYWFSPGKGQYNHDPADPHPFRGVATGDVDPPAGYDAADFQIPLFTDVLAELPPGTKINIDMKDQSGFTPKGVAAAHALADILQAQPGGDNENVIVASFGSEEIEAFNDDMPDHLSLSGSEDAISAYVFSGQPFDPEIQAIQPPDKYEYPSGSGNYLDAPEFIKTIMDIQGDDYAIHVWGADDTVEDDALFKRLVDAGVQGFFPQRSVELAAFLCANHVPDATGAPRCTPPAPPRGPIGQLGKLSSKKGKVKAGKKAKIHGSITNGGDQAMTNVRACVDIPRKLHKKLKARCVTVGDVAPGATVKFTITVKTKKKAKGKYKLAVSVTSDNGGMQTGTAKIKVKKAKKGGKKK